MDGLNLVEGGVLYVTADGTGASWGTGPPPLGSHLLLWFDPASSKLFYRMTQQGSEWAAMAAYDSLSGRLKSVRRDAKAITRLSSSIPADIRASCGPELWAPERARQKALVDGMTLYFPSLGYRELTPAQRAVDPHRFREDALHFLQKAGELPLHSLGRQGLEVYRLIRVGEAMGVIRVQRDAQGKAWADVVAEDSRTGNLASRTLSVTAEGWAGLETAAKKARLGELPPRVGEDSDVVDGWILEHGKDGKGRSVECPDPNPDAFKELCLFIQRLAGFTP
jgi:hypothetical protein